MPEPSQQPRSTADLIRELEAEAECFTKVWLVVGFEHTTLFVLSGAPDNLRELNEMVLHGGEPIGFVAYRLQGKGCMEVSNRTLAEYADEPWAKKYLEDLTRKFIQRLRAADRPAS